MQPTNMQPTINNTLNIRQRENQIDDDLYDEYSEQEGEDEQKLAPIAQTNQQSQMRSNAVLKDVRHFVAANKEEQDKVLKAVNESLGKITPLERDSLFTATTGVMSALGNGVSVKSAAKAGGAVLGVGIVGTLGGCLAYAAAKAATASTGAGATVKELGDALKETMTQVFPEALIAIAAAALLAVIAKMVYDAMQNAAKNINSTDTQTRLYKAQEKMQKAQSDLASNPSDPKAHKAMEDAIKDMIDLGSQKVSVGRFKGEDGKMVNAPEKPLLKDVQPLQDALKYATQLRKLAEDSHSPANETGESTQKVNTIKITATGASSKRMPPKGMPPQVVQQIRRGQRNN